MHGMVEVQSRRVGCAARHFTVPVPLKRVTSASIHRRCLLRHGRTFTVVAAAPQRGSQQQEQDARKSNEDDSRRRLRFRDKPIWPPQPLQEKKPVATGLYVRPTLSSPSSVLLYLAARWQELHSTFTDGWGKLLYNYFNWRQDTSKDLLLIFMVFSSFVLLGSSTLHWFIDSETERMEGGFWNDVYQVCKWVFGQEFPGPESQVAQQAFAVVTAMVGLCEFALVLALVEQVVLEGMEANVKRGSKVYESGHHLILGWCVSQRDLEVVRKIIQQICVAYAPEGGTKIVVLTQRSKLEMEALFTRCLPASKRFDSRLVFRQGSPLVPSDLKLVEANSAASTVIVSDQSRSAVEADAQAIRCAILLDELDAECRAERDAVFSDKCCGRSVQDSECSISSTDDDMPGISAMQQQDISMAGRQVVVELKTSNALPLLKYACSNKTIAMPTNQLNAQRLAKMVKRPVISIVSQQLFNFENRVSIFVHYYPHLAGHRFGDLPFLFPDGIVMGLVDRITGKARMAPSKDYVILASQALVICRPTTVESHTYHPLKQSPNMAELLMGYSNTVCHWTHRPERVQQDTGSGKMLVPAASMPDNSAAPVASKGSMNQEWLPAMEDWSKAGISQVEALRRQVEADGQAIAVAASLHSATPTARGLSEIGHTEQNNIVSLPKVDAGSVVDVTRLVAASQPMTAGNVLCRGKAWTAPPSAAMNSLSTTLLLPTLAPQQQHQSKSSSAAISHAKPLSQDVSSGFAVMISNSSSGRKTPEGLRTTDWPVLSGLSARHAKYGYAALWRRLGMPGQKHHLFTPGLGSVSTDGRGGGRVHQALGALTELHEPVAEIQATLRVPSEYLQVDEGPERVLVLGWGPNSLMADLIKELDHGLSALPAGSEVVFANTHNPGDTIGTVLQNTTLEYIKVRHVHANPLQRSSLAAKLDMSSFRCALVLCDELWVDPDKDDANGIDSLDEPSVLRLDSLVMVAQLNVRKLLEDGRLPPINIICQKVATEGLTRFEDRHRLPLGISVNLNSFSAKTLAQIAVNPLMLYPVTRLGEDAQLTIVDASDYASLDESINFWQLVARCQVVGDVLLGYYAIPEHLDEPLNTVVDPIGVEERCLRRVWNNGDGRLKFIVLRAIKHRHESASHGSVDDHELSTTQRAHWVSDRHRDRGNSTSSRSNYRSGSTTGSSNGSSPSASAGSAGSSNHNSITGTL